MVETDLGWALGTVAKEFRRIAAGAVDDLPGGPRGFLTLSAVAAGEARSQLALARRLGLDKTVMTYLLDDLEAAGLVTRRLDPADRRARQVVITEKGTATVTTARAQVEVAEKHVLAGLDAKEAATLRELLRRAAAHLQG